MNDRVSIQIEQAVAHVRLTRPSTMNALDNEMFDALVAAGEQLKKNTSLRCVVLSGEGRAFCAGLDKSVVTQLGSDDTAILSRARGLTRRTHGIANREQYTALVWRDLPVPVIAAVHGFALGGGLQLALGADLRYVTPDARLSIMEIKWGLIPDMAGTVLMRNLVREDIARELTYTGRIFSGTDALEYGLATRVCADPVAEALASATAIASNSPDAVRAAKRLFNELPESNSAAALLQESQEQEYLLGRPQHAEAVAANLEKRAPKFEL